jgi:class 3 adenylate cyclase
VIAQAIVAADGEVRMRAPAHPGRYRLFMRGGTSGHVIVSEGASDSVRIDASPMDEDGALGDHEVAPGGDLVVHQQGGSERHVKLERIGWSAKAASASMVATIPEFRRLFSGEALRPGTSLRVGRVTLLFTDLTSSTLMYRNVGDARAFKIVQDHFELLDGIVAEHHGAVVKTMGDAVMAVFMVEQDALRCALAIDDRLPAFRAEREDAELCFLKMGVHSGPCYAVTANGILDYFGQTVNVAARLQSEARAGELVMTADLYQRSEATVGSLAVEEFDAHLKGVGEVTTVRVQLDQPNEGSGLSVPGH